MPSAAPLKARHARRLSAGVVAAALLTVAAHGVSLPAQPVASVSQAAPAPTAGGPVRSDRADPGSRWQVHPCLGGLSYGAPLRWAAAYGGGFVREGDRQDLCLLGIGQLGLGGAGAHVGVANAIGRFGSGTAVTAGLLRTFGRPLDATPHRTYVGVSLHVWAIVAIGGQLGYYRRVGADGPGLSAPRGLITWSTGFGF